MTSTWRSAAEDADLADSLRRNVVELEVALGAQNNPETMLAELEEVEQELRQAEAVLL